MSNPTVTAARSQDATPQIIHSTPAQRILRNLQRTIRSCESLLRQHDSRNCNCQLCGAVFGILWALESGESQIEALLDRAAADREQAERVQPSHIVDS